MSLFEDAPTVAYEPVRLGVGARPYQVEGRNAWIAYQAAGGRRGLIVCPTGTGKSILAIMIAVETPARVLLIAHREEILEQFAEKIAALAPGVSFGIIQGERNANRARIVLAMIQTICRKKRLAELVASHAADPFGLIAVDEAHHAAAKTYQAVLDALANVAAFGLTATPFRADARGLARVWGAKPVFRYTLGEAIEQGYLCDYEPRRIICPNLDFGRVARTADGEFSADDAEKEMVRAHAAEAVADEVVKAIEAGRKPIVFAVTVDQSRRIAELVSLKYPAAHVSGETSRELRKTSIQGFRSGRIRAMTNVGVFGEGFDDPSIDCVVNAAPTASKAVYMQRVGRGLRPFFSKEVCWVIDLVGSTEVHDLVTADALDVDEDDTAGPKCKRDDCGHPQGAHDGSGKGRCSHPACPCPKFSRQKVTNFCGDDKCMHRRRDHPKGEGCTVQGCSCGKFKYRERGEWMRLKGFASAAQDGHEARHKPKSLARVAWIEVVPDTLYALPAGKAGSLVLYREKGEWGGDPHALWLGYILPSDAWSVREARPVMHNAVPRDLATGVMEDYARRIKAFALSAADAKWRKDPPTTEQQAMLAKLDADVVPLTRGEASDLITKIKLKKLWDKPTFPGGITT